MTLTVVQETNTYVINRETRWLYQTCWVRTPAGEVELWDIPVEPWNAR